MFPKWLLATIYSCLTAYYMFLKCKSLIPVYKYFTMLTYFCYAVKFGFMIAVMVFSVEHYETVLILRKLEEEAEMAGEMKEEQHGLLDDSAELANGYKSESLVGVFDEESAISNGMKSFEIDQYANDDFNGGDDNVDQDKCIIAIDESPELGGRK